MAAEPFYARIDRIALSLLRKHPEARSQKDDIVQEVATSLYSSYTAFHETYLSDLSDLGDETRTCWRIHQLLRALLSELDEKGAWEPLQRIKAKIVRCMRIVEKKVRTPREFVQLIDYLQAIARIGPEVIYSNRYLRTRIAWKMSDVAGAQQRIEKKFVPLDTGAQGEQGGTINVPASNPCPELGLRRKRAVDRAKREMDPTTKRVAYLAGRGETQEEIAVRLGISIRTVQRRVEKAREILEKKLREEGLST